MYIHGVAKSQTKLRNSHWTNWTEYKKKTTQGRRKVNNNQIGKGSENLKNYSTSEFPCPFLFLNSTAQLWPNSQNSTAETHTKNAERNFLILATGLGKRKSQSKPKSTRYIFPFLPFSTEFHGKGAPGSPRMWGYTKQEKTGKRPSILHMNKYKSYAESFSPVPSPYSVCLLSKFACVEQIHRQTAKALSLNYNIRNCPSPMTKGGVVPKSTANAENSNDSGTTTHRRRNQT